MPAHSTSPLIGVDLSTPAGATMRAVVAQGYGSSDVLRLAQVALPTMAADEVLVRVHAAGLDRGTWHLMTGRPFLQRPVTGLRAPRQPILGHDLAGTVVATGSGTTRYQVGDEVYGFANGSFADFAAVREAKLAPKPTTVTFEQAAVMPVSAATALRALTDVGHLETGQRVLVTGASGGVGSYAVQLAKALGAEVTGVASTAKLDLVRGLGADHVIDYTRADFADGAHRYDLIVDIAGRPTLARLRRALTRTGTAVIVGGEDGGELTGGMNRQLRAVLLSPFVSQRLTLLVANERGSDLERLTTHVEAGRVTPPVDRTYALHEARDAMRHLESGHVRGKVAVTMGAVQ